MFGRRADGRINTKIDPIVRFTPVIMKHRYDAQVFVKIDVDYDSMSAYIRKKNIEGIRLTHMNLVVAAIAKVLQQFPELNRFIMGRKIYNRNEITISYTILKEDFQNEATIKAHFPIDGHVTVFDVAKQMEEEIAENKVVESANMTDKLAKIFLAIPAFPSIGFGLISFLDKIGVLPKALLDASPFHTSVYVTNTASIRLGYVYHHIYDFGTTSVFASMGLVEKRPYLDLDGTGSNKHIMPFGFSIDERISPGVAFSKGVAMMQRYLNHPELMEK